jgi:glycine cleavage system H protein
VLEVNEDLTESPEVINDDPYGKGWIAVIEVDDTSEMDDLMDSAEYAKYIEEEAK